MTQHHSLEAINHFGHPFIIIREDYIKICRDDACAAALLNIFEQWYKVKSANMYQTSVDNVAATFNGMPTAEDSPWVYMSGEKMHEDLLGVFGEKKISEAMKILEAEKFVLSRHNPKYKWDRTKQYAFQPGAVQAAIDELEHMALIDIPQNGGMESAKPPIRQGETAEAIPQNQPKIPAQNQPPSSSAGRKSVVNLNAKPQIEGDDDYYSDDTDKPKPRQKCALEIRLEREQNGKMLSKTVSRNLYSKVMTSQGEMASPCILWDANPRFSEWVESKIEYWKTIVPHSDVSHLVNIIRKYDNGEHGWLHYNEVRHKMAQADAAKKNNFDPGNVEGIKVEQQEKDWSSVSWDDLEEN